MQGRFVSVYLFVCCALFGTGCSLNKPVAKQIVAFNRAVGEAHNQVVLLNAVRAMHRFPQQYTSVTDVRGTATTSLTPALSLTFKNGDGTSGVPSLSATRSGGASLVTVDNLDDQEFFQGVLNPIDLDQISFLLAQGWPERLVGLLLIRQIEIKDDDWTDPSGDCKCDNARRKHGNLTIYTNEPQEWNEEDPFCSVRCFSARLLDMRAREKLVIKNGRQVPVGPELQPDQIKDLGSLILSAQKDGVRLTQVRKKSAYQLTKQAPKVLSWMDERAAIDSDPRPGDKRAKATFYFRSPVGLVYYLGEIMRSQAMASYASGRDLNELEPRICETVNPLTNRCDQHSLLFFAREAENDEDESRAFVSVEHLGSTWVIPPSCAEPASSSLSCHRSMQVLSIVKQLVGLNNSRKASPTTGVVTVAGG